MRKTYQGRSSKSNQKFEVVDRQLAVHLPLPVVEVWEELQPEVEHLTGMAGLKIIRAVIEEEVTRLVGVVRQMVVRCIKRISSNLAQALRLFGLGLEADSAKDARRTGEAYLRWVTRKRV